MRIGKRPINLLKTTLWFSIEFGIKTVEQYPRVGILRPILSSAKKLIFNREKNSSSLWCQNVYQPAESVQIPKMKIMEVTTFSEQENKRGVANYLQRLFLQVSESELESITFISFANHDKAANLPKLFLGRPIYYIDSGCINCVRVARHLAQSSSRLLFTSYFHRNITPELCSALIQSAPTSSAIVYDLIPKVDKLNFSELSIMASYHDKFNLLTGVDVYAISKTTQVEIETYGLEVKGVLRYPLANLDSAKFHLNKKILLFGSMNPRKNVLRAIIAWDSICPEFPEYKLMLIGRYSNLAKLLIRSLMKSNENAICFSGEISDVEINKLMCTSKLLVAPSTNEGLGLPLIMAIESGTPIICSKIDAYLELVSNNNSFFDPYSVNDICRVLRRAILSSSQFSVDINSVKIGTIKLSEIL